jgi:hypothetical protein
VINRKPNAQAWAFKARFRRGAFGWRAQPAVQRVKEAVREIKKAARRDPILAADGAVAFLERVSPALENVDSSSGSIGTAVNNAIDELVPMIARAEADPKIRERWLERLWAAHEDDQIPYIETLGEHWGDLCASREVASRWADELLSTTRLALSQDRSVRGFFHGTTACLSALLAAERYDDILDVLAHEGFWHYKVWAVRALAALGRTAEALQMAESSRGPYASDRWIDAECERILLSSGRAEEAYERYGLSANLAGTYLATFRAIALNYPHKAPAEILNDLVATTPGEEGKWFATAKELGLYQEALALATLSPCDPKTLTRAAGEFATENPDFALGAGLLALHWLVKGYGYEITGADVWAAYSKTIATGDMTARGVEVRERIRQMIKDEGQGGFVRSILDRELDL